MTGRRYVVSDTNAFIAGLHRFLAEDDRVVICEHLIAEILDSKKRQVFEEKFQKWYRQRGQQIWVAKGWERIAQEEASPHSRTVGLAWRDEYASNRMRACALDGRIDWSRSWQEDEIAAAKEAHEKKKQCFVNDCHWFADHLRRRCWHDAKALMNFPAAKRAEYIRAPHLGGVWRPGHERRYNSPRWKIVLNQWPDVMAWGRWSRIRCWYGLQAVVSDANTPNFANNYEDALYAMAASYTGHLATADIGLREMVNAVFGDRVKVLGVNSH